MLIALALCLVTVRPGFARIETDPVLNTSQDFLAAVARDESTGQLTLSDAMLLRFQFAFEADALPPQYRISSFSPLKCGADLIRRYYSLKDQLTPGTVSAIEQYLRIPSSRLSHTSSEGHFVLTYELNGVDAVPAEDSSPANGVPDFVEKAAQYLEQSYTVEILMSEFFDPLQAQSTYPVSFRSMQNYGFAYPINEMAGTTGMVLNNTFEGFPSNDDPEGNALGAMKVTAAHELKHASQYVGSRWEEGGWIELDAVWMEDFVFDQVNDYHNYLIGGSPIRHPETPLDGGSTGTGSYEDCVWQIWMQETWGIAPLVEFWNRRAYRVDESVMETYEEVLDEQGQSLAEAWGQFTAWNYATGYRAIWGLGYQEAAQYPFGSLVANVNSYPAQITGEVEHLAANFIRLLELDDGHSGNLTLEWTSSENAGPLTLNLVIKKVDGSGWLENVPIEDDESVTYISEVPLEEMASAGIVVGHGGPDSGPASYQLNVYKNVQLPVPQLEVLTPEVFLQVPPGEMAQEAVLIGNQGQDNSVLHFTASLWSQDPTPVVLAAAAHDLPLAEGERNISGSNLVADENTYLPGSALDLELTLTNGSTDDEWLTGLSLTMPAGVSLQTANDFVGGSLGDLEWDGATGYGVTTGWQGTYGSSGYGVIRDGEQATAQIQLFVASGFQGPLVLEAVISGDHFGGNPHTVATSITLSRHAPQLTVTSPEAGHYAALGENLPIAWQQDGSLDEVTIFLSRNGGETWLQLTEVPASAGEFSWPVSGPMSLDCLVRVSTWQGTSHADSPGPFTIYPAADGMSLGADLENIQVGSVNEGDMAPVIVAAEASALPPGDSQAWLLIQHDGPQSAAVVPVTVRVGNVTSIADLPLVTALRGIHPNPFNPRTSIAFELAAAQPLHLEILDLRGHRVRQLLSGREEAGWHEVIFDGRDDHGRNLPAGVYLARLVTARGTTTMKLVLAK